MNQTPRTLRPYKSATSTFKTSMLLLVSALFTFGGILMLPREALKGAFIIAFFGLCSIVFLVQLLPGSSWLSLDAEGFTYCALFRKHHVRWQDVESFTVVSVGMNSLVGWSFVENFEGSVGGRKLSRALSGVDAALPDNYGKNVGELAELMDSFLVQAR